MYFPCGPSTAALILLTFGVERLCGDITVQKTHPARAASAAPGIILGLTLILGV